MKRWLVMLMIIALLAGTMCLSLAEDEPHEAAEETVEAEPEPEPKLAAEPEPEDKSDAEDNPQSSDDKESAQPAGEDGEDSGDPGDDSDAEPGESSEGDPTPAPSVSPTPSPLPEDGPEEPEEPGEETADADVLRIQSWLIALDYLPSGGRTGVYDEATASAVAAFQDDHDLEVTGICDDDTYALLKALAEAADSADDPTVAPTTAPSRSPSGGDGGGSGDYEENDDPDTSDVTGAGASGGSGGSRSSGGSGSSGSSGSSGASGSDSSSGNARDWLNGVTPGTALTSSHVSGSKDTTPYGSVDLDADAAALGITLENGSYERILSNDALLLKGTSGAAAWHFDGAALCALARSGIGQVSLISEDRVVLLDTEDAFEGIAYDTLRKLGYTDNTFVYTVSGEEITVNVNGQRYRATPGPEGKLELIAE